MHCIFLCNNNIIVIFKTFITATKNFFVFVEVEVMMMMNSRTVM